MDFEDKKVSKDQVLVTKFSLRLPTRALGPPGAANTLGEIQLSWSPATASSVSPAAAKTICSNKCSATTNVTQGFHHSHGTITQPWRRKAMCRTKKLTLETPKDDFCI